MNEDVKRLEEKIAYLERHVVEQDRAMLEMADDIARLRREVRALQARAEPRRASGEDDLSGADERPPHY